MGEGGKREGRGSDEEGSQKGKQMLIKREKRCRCQAASGAAFHSFVKGDSERPATKPRPFEAAEPLHCMSVRSVATLSLDGDKNGF